MAGTGLLADRDAVVTGQESTAAINARRAAELKVAIVHEWFTTIGGSESVVEQLCELYPDAVLHALCVDPKTVESVAWLRYRELRTSAIQKLPQAAVEYRRYLPLMPLAVEQFDLSAFDIVLSSSHAVAKGVLTGPDQLHISYVHSPMRYAWDLQHQYLRESGLGSGAKGWLAKWLLHKLRLWDYRTAAGVDHFVANSRFVARRIAKVYGRLSDVIYPPVDVDRFQQRDQKDPFFITASRMVPYKRIDLIVEAFSAMPDLKLVVAGSGPEAGKVKAKAGPNVEIIGYQEPEALKDLMQRARAFVFAAEEDFGIAPVEALACGTPVIAFGKGGATETVQAEGARPTGLFFEEQTVEALCRAVRAFDALRDRFEPAECRRSAERFSAPRFRQEFGRYVEARLADRETPQQDRLLFARRR